MNNKISYLRGCIINLTNDINNRLKPNPGLPPLIMVMMNNNVGRVETEGQNENGLRIAN
jgi:hypothetical protein